MAGKFRCRPSELYDIDDPLVAFYFDKAVFTFGTRLEGAMQKARDKAKNSKAGDAAAQRVWQKWMADSEEAKAAMFKAPPVS